MIKYEEHLEQGYVQLTIDGKVDREGFEEIVAKLGPAMKEHGKLGLLKIVHSFTGMTPAVFWDDLKFAFGHLKHVGAVAVVSDKKWIEVWTKLATPFWTEDVRFFESDELDEARRWLAERKPKPKAVGG